MILILLASVVALTGCVKLDYLDEALRLKAYSEEKDAQTKQVAAQDAAFDRLWRRIKSEDNVAALVTGASVRALYGAPVAVLPVSDRAGCVEWLYRYQLKYFDGPRVYFMVNAQDRVLSVRTDHAR